VIRHATGAGDVALARRLFEEYAAWLDEDLCFQSFAVELATLPGKCAQAVIDEARAAGYAQLKLDTLERMADARRLYEALGFERCDPCYHNPLGAPVYMALDLRVRGSAR
jgi:GNAT superfamily N-acetyltransferase